VPEERSFDREITPLMKHLTDDELALYAFDPEAAANRGEIETHLERCPQCQSELALIRSVDDSLRESDVWEIVESDVKGREAVRRFAATVAAENEEAERLLEPFLRNPARTAFGNLGSKRVYVTAGVARRLIRAAAEACEREPLEALTYADAAIDVSERLSGYSDGMTHDLRANAWKERANALTALGKYGESLDSLKHAEREFGEAPTGSVGLAIVGYMRATVHYFRGDLSDAAVMATRSCENFSELGETDRYMRARHLLASIAFARGDIRAARTIYEELLAWGEVENDVKWIARESNTLGRCALELGEITAAVQSFHRSLQAFRQAGLSAEALRPEWGLALVTLASGRHEDALARLSELRAEFHRRGMLSDEALVALDMMDALHALDRDRVIITIAAQLIQSFASAGMLTSALAAFAFLKEAAGRGTVTPTVTKYIRRFLSRLERQPALLFLPPEEKL
jgi:tetratricopeptide (TPR) repeat protein